VIDRGAQLLALVLESDAPRGLTDLAQDAGLPKSTASRLIDALERNGLVERDPTRTHVRPGPREVRYAQSGRDLAELAEPAMRRLASESGETVNLMVRTAGGAEAIAQVDGRHVLGDSNWIGREVPDHCSAAGKVFLAFGASTAREPLERRTARTIVNADQLERELAGVREHGFATIVDELELGLAALAARRRDHDGAVVAALSVAGPTALLGDARLGLLGRVAIEQAHAVSVQLGYEGDLEDLLDSLRARRQ